MEGTPGCCRGSLHLGKREYDNVNVEKALKNLLEKMKADGEDESPSEVQTTF